MHLISLGHTSCLAPQAPKGHCVSRLLKLMGMTMEDPCGVGVLEFVARAKKFMQVIYAKNDRSSLKDCDDHLFCLV